VVYVGHEGLMDLSLPALPHKDKKDRCEAIVVACISKSYFGHPLLATGAKPLLWTTSVMAPEAYMLKSALDGWVLVANEAANPRSCRSGLTVSAVLTRRAKRLLVTGF